MRMIDWISDVCSSDLFSLEELMLRIEAVLRRNRTTAPSRLSVGDIVLDEDAYRVWRGDEEITLSPTEFLLLRYLLLHRNRVVSKNQILDHAWDYEFRSEESRVGKEGGRTCRYR